MRNWSPTVEDFDGHVPAEILHYIRDWSVELRPDERVECVAVATVPRIVLLVMSNTHLNRAYLAGSYEFDGDGRSGLWGRIEGDQLVISTKPGGPGDAYGGLVPAGSAQRLAAELHKPFQPDDGPGSGSAAHLRW